MHQQHVKDAASNSQTHGIRLNLGNHYIRPCEWQEMQLMADQAMEAGGRNPPGSSAAW